MTDHLKTAISNKKTRLCTTKVLFLFLESNLANNYQVTRFWSDVSFFSYFNRR